MKSTASILSIIAALSLFFSCANSSGGDSGDSKDDSDDPKPMAAYAGTWGMSYAETSSSEIYEYSGSYTVDADGNYSSKVVHKTTPVGGSASYEYSDEKGMIGIDGDYLTCKVTAERDSYSGPFADDSAGWASVSKSYGQTVLISGNKAYVDVFKAEGAVSGIEGNWACVRYSSTRSKPYKKTVDAFSSGDLTENVYSSATSSYPSTPSNIDHGVYSLSGGKVTITYDGEDPETQYYAIQGSYLILGGQNSLDERAFVKK